MSLNVRGRLNRIDEIISKSSSNGIEDMLRNTENETKHLRSRPKRRFLKATEVVNCVDAKHGDDGISPKRSRKVCNLQKEENRDSGNETETTSEPDIVPPIQSSREFVSCSNIINKFVIRSISSYDEDADDTEDEEDLFAFQEDDEVSNNFEHDPDVNELAELFKSLKLSDSDVIDESGEKAKYQDPKSVSESLKSETEIDSTLKVMKVMKKKPEEFVTSTGPASHSDTLRTEEPSQVPKTPLRSYRVRTHDSDSSDDECTNSLVLQPKRVKISAWHPNHFEDNDDELFVPIRTKPNSSRTPTLGNTDSDVASLTSMLQRSRIRRHAVVEEDDSDLDLSDFDLALADDVFEDSSNEDEEHNLCNSIANSSNNEKEDLKYPKTLNLKE